MGISSVLMLISSDFRVVEEVDFDKALEDDLTMIAHNLEKDHPFRKLMSVLDSGTADVALNEKMAELAGEQGEEMGFVVVTPNQLSEFKEYVGGSVEHQWAELFPGRKPGVRGWIDYHFRLKTIERTYAAKPQDSDLVWLRDIYSLLLETIRKGIEAEYYVLRLLY